ncbi:DUF695 domain-containing protein [Luteolibacter pohnpeiensis]|uniref:DUF695 domain-containing protein n=1 Tax=Luteolibacter pohnpeiensis TaxID=454153 RepID=A0A934VXL5_9BACT|nr:DUF695 domain-containing protein [Luteolibacter pohnpeiensis]MBK1884495.1 DUF695 domain-containing protein [Luteolibacter pohnpeiensis]
MKTIPHSDSDAWNIAEGESGGQPILIRYRPSLEEHLGDTRYPRRLTITWEFDTNSSGMPSDQVADEMRDFEDVIDAALDPEMLAILAFVHTHGVLAGGTTIWRTSAPSENELMRRFPINQDFQSN